LCKQALINHRITFGNHFEVDGLAKIMALEGEEMFTQI
jgi:hypothetical protein